MNMKFSLAANAVQARQTKERFAKPEEKLSYELGKAVQELPPLYTRLLAGTISVVIFGAISWAHFSEIDEVATATGELIASTQVRPVTALGNGSILAVKVKEGDRVEKGDVLMVLDTTTSKAQVKSLDQVRRSLRQENKFYRALMSGKVDVNNLDSTITALKIPPEVASLSRNRAEINDENELFN
ncbi:MAG: hypothetical protein RLZZ184_3223, partial [Cyanobacteriota bacterium]